jgi:hypothetical protein
VHGGFAHAPRLARGILRGGLLFARGGQQMAAIDIGQQRDARAHAHHPVRLGRQGMVAVEVVGAKGKGLGPIAGAGQFHPALATPAPASASRVRGRRSPST